MHLAALKAAGMTKRMAIASTHTRRMQQLSLNGFKRRVQHLNLVHQKFTEMH
ncbi:MAG: hypothetical protein F6K30_28220 [Cyanothece sp. SIO2G6]|nr:hypothetical protein [Cyanothece sp. SIO2G6]